MKCKQLSPTQFTPNDVDVISHEQLYRGFFSLSQYQFRHRLYQGGMSGIVKREVFERGMAVGLLAYDAKTDQVVLVEQIRFPALKTSQTPWLIEVIAGICEAGESDEDVARREAQEEAGLEIGRIKPIVNYLASPGGSDERLALYVGETDASCAGGYHGLSTENEDILVRVVSREEAYQWVESGVIDNAATIIALQWLQLHHQQLTAEWTL